MIDNYYQVSLWLWWLVTSVIIIACSNPDNRTGDKNKVTATRVNIDGAESFEHL